MSDTRRFAKAAIQLIVIGVFASWTALGFYIYKFAPGHWFTLSGDPNDWASFGTFLGGILGPFFSWLAFLGVLFTVVLQAKQIESTRHQASLEEMQRVASGIAARIDERLARPPIAAPGPAATFMQVPFHDLISAYATWRLSSKHDDYIVEAKFTSNFDTFIRSASADLRSTGLDFEALGWCLNKYREAGGSELVLEFYHYRYMAMSCWFDAVWDMKAHRQFQEFFKPALTRPMMTNDSPKSAT